MLTNDVVSFEQLGPGSCRGEVEVFVYVYKVVDYPVDHFKLQLCSPGLKDFPLDLAKYV